MSETTDPTAGDAPGDTCDCAAREAAARAEERERIAQATGARYQHWHGH